MTAQKTITFDFQPYGVQTIDVQSVEPVNYDGPRLADWQKNRMKKGWVRVVGIVAAGVSVSRIGAHSHTRDLAGTRFCEEMPAQDYEAGHYVRVAM